MLKLTDEKSIRVYVPNLMGLIRTLEKIIVFMLIQII